MTVSDLLMLRYVAVQSWNNCGGKALDLLASIDVVIHSCSLCQIHLYSTRIEGLWCRLRTAIRHNRRGNKKAWFAIFVKHGLDGGFCCSLLLVGLRQLQTPVCSHYDYLVQKDCIRQVAKGVDSYKHPWPSWIEQMHYALCPACRPTALKRLVSMYYTVNIGHCLRKLKPSSQSVVPLLLDEVLIKSEWLQNAVNGALK